MVTTETTTMQLWPSGRTVTFIGDGWDGRVSIVSSEGEALQQPSEEEMALIRDNVRALRYLERDILTCQSGLVDACIQAGMDGFDLYDADNVSNMETNADAMDAGECRAWLKERGHSLPDVPEVDCGVCHGHGDIARGDHDTHECETCEGTGLVSGNFDTADDDDDYVDALREAVRDHAETAEVMEWWLVSGWLGRQLAGLGEVVLDNGLGVWWGRQCSGQALIMDGVLQRVARECA